MQIYLVGGAVRDGLLGLTVQERDYCVVGATPEYFLSKGYKPVGKDFPVFLHPETKEEYALARTERKVGPGYHGFVFQADSTVSLEEDLGRRDLTINAMAQSIEGLLIDPYGGVQDIQDRKLRHVSLHFIEDPVRVLRLARFAAKFASQGFVIAEETKTLVQKMLENQECKALVSERVFRETMKAMGEKTPQVYFEVLQKLGALEQVFGSIEHWDVQAGVDLLVLYKNKNSDPELRLSAFIFGSFFRSGVQYEKFFKKLPCTKRIHRYVTLAVKSHAILLKETAISNQQALDLFYQWDVFRRSETLDILMDFMQAFDPDYPHRQALETRFICVQAVDPETVLKDVPSWKKAIALKEARLIALHDFLKE